MKLSDARVEALRQRITNRGAIEKLVAAGEIAAGPTPYGVRVRWLGEESGS